MLELFGLVEGITVFLIIHTIVVPCGQNYEVVIVWRRSIAYGDVFHCQLLRGGM